MELIHVKNQPPESSDPIVLCIGKFDGVHIGHQKLLKTANEALNPGVELAVMSFSPHPTYALTGNDTFKKALTPVNEKLRLLEQFNVARFYRVNFTKEYAKIDVDTFVFEHLTRLNLKGIVVGEGFNFGKPYDSGTDVLKKYCFEIGVPVTVVPVSSDDGKKISSTDIRRYITEGQVDKAEDLLGRHYQVTGTCTTAEEPNHYDLILESEHNNGVDDYVLPLEGIYELKVESLIQNESDGNQPVSARGYKNDNRENCYHLDVTNHASKEDDFNHKEVRVSFIQRVE